MIKDYEMELTTSEGQDIAGTGYGSKTYVQKAATGAVGEALAAMFRVRDEDFDNLDSVELSIVGDDDGAGTNEEVIVKKTLTLAELTVALGRRYLGVLPPNPSKKCLRFKYAVTGSNPGQGLLEVWLTPHGWAA